MRYFERRLEDGFRVDPEEVERKITPRTRLIVLTNLHNPSGALIDEQTLRAVGEIAKKNNARVLVDEVYLEAMYEQRPRPAIHLGEQFLVTSSLTKAFGLSGVRCGWVLANPELAERMWHINDLYGVNAALSRGTDQRDRTRQSRSRSGAREETAGGESAGAGCVLAIARRSRVRSAASSAPSRFPKLKTGSVDELDRLLREKYETGFVPGRYFDMPQHFRIGIGGDPEMTRIAFERLGTALDELRLTDGPHRSFSRRPDGNCNLVFTARRTWSPNLI